MPFKKTYFRLWFCFMVLTMSLSSSSHHPTILADKAGEKLKFPVPYLSEECVVKTDPDKWSLCVL
jgi:hypothetical protein